MILHGFFRSGASWRVRIALRLKGLEAEQVSWRLREGDVRSDAYRALNPQALVPTLVLDGGERLTQSLAICEYLDEIYPDPPFLPADPLARARVRAVAQAVACDMHPLQNLKVLLALRRLGHDEATVHAWARGAIEEGFDALEILLDETGGPFAFGDRPGLADICLVPQFLNGKRFGLSNRWPRLESIVEACMALEAFSASVPDRQPDAV